ncbi:restriction endonuclease subunit S [Pseudomonas citronellolis]|uniref:Restriction endonuclease subunit S n=1 Tax=Pseudomonas citronellolis TaxID=53408 RepID=A0AAW6PFJ4_9PSED|nr:restriction endonuclease subunit S [Pseudomonas citronellolis]MDF3844934.1 restriction endonuclease subunit S [Pseudomonas citronellolis]
MSGNEKQPLMPRLRFPEFKNTAEWQSPTLGEVSEPVEERVGERKLTPVSISAGIGFVPQAEKFGRDISGSQYKLYTVVRDGDFVYNKGNSLKFPQGCVYDLQGWGEVAAPNVFICFRLKNGYENGFYRQCFERNTHGIQLRKHITSGARSNGLLNISKEAFYSVAIPVPSHAEQQKIADCLSSLDDLIAVETRKLDTLKTHKKGLMQQLFPREGETVPRLRFPEFRGAGGWEVKALDQLGELVSGLTYSPDDVRDEGLLVLRSSNVQDGRIVLDDNVYVRSDIKGASPSLPNDILICVRNGSKSLIGKNALIPEDMPPCTHGAFMTVFRSGAAKFVIQLFQTEAYERQVAADLGATINSINGNQLKKYKFRVPEAKEQQVIADCLSSFDDLITAQTQKIDALKTHKKGLMQQLFPTLDEVGA